MKKNLYVSSKSNIQRSVTSGSGLSKVSILEVVALWGNYRTRAIINRGLYTLYPLFEVHLCTVTFGLMYGYYSRAVSNQEWVIVARVRYLLIESKVGTKKNTFEIYHKS